MYKKYIINQALRKTDEIRSKASQSCENALITFLFLKKADSFKKLCFSFLIWCVCLSLSLLLGVCVCVHAHIHMLCVKGQLVGIYYCSPFSLCGT